MPKVYIDPPLSGAMDGIHRVISAQHRLLPEFGFEITGDINEADLTVGHASNMPMRTDVPFCVANHGCYWREYNWNSTWASDANKHLVHALSRAQAITVPSRWVRDAITRGLLREPEVIYHGVDVKEWGHREPNVGYVLWNKARVDPVSDPKDMQQLARLLPDVKFVTTLGIKAGNVSVIGALDYEEMKPVVQRAGVYLATTRETFGIGTLEALASGTPVVGWDYGGQSEIIKQGETGYLVEYGNYQRLAEAVREALSDRKRLSDNARADVLDRWQWHDKIERYAYLYQRVLDDWHTPRPKVSVVVPAYNLAKYLPDTLNSVLAQTMSSWECLVVDDCSTDDTATVTREFIKQDIRIKYYKTPQNLGLSGVRNFGARNSTGKYVMCLDADDMLTQNSLGLLADALDKNREIDIAYGSLDLINEDGTGQRRNEFPNGFNWFAQMAHQNQVSTNAMMRREVIENSGGWRVSCKRAEDAEFWARVTSFGYRAEQVTKDTTLLYRIRSNSKGMQERRANKDIDGNWLANLNWATAESGDAGKEFLKQNGFKVLYPERVPFGAQGELKDGFWTISHQQNPLVTVIVNALTTNGDNLTNILDNLIGQVMDRWEVYVIGEKVTGFPFAHFVKSEKDIRCRGVITYYVNGNQTMAQDELLNLVKDHYKLAPVQQWLREYRKKYVSH